jgi:hypothetical protein
MASKETDLAAQIKELARVIKQSGSGSAPGGRSSVPDAESLGEVHGKLSKASEQLADTLGVENKAHAARLRNLNLQRKAELAAGKKSLRQSAAQQKRLDLIDREHERALRKVKESNLKVADANKKIEELSKRRARDINREMIDDRAARARGRQLQAKEYARELAESGKERAKGAIEGQARKGLGPSGFGGDAMGGAANFLMTKGPWGIAAAAAGALLGAKYTRDLENAAFTRKRFLNYGKGEDEPGARRQQTQEEATTDYRGEMKKVALLRESSKELAYEFNADADVIASSLVRAATKTGDSFESVTKNVGRALAELEFQGVGTMDELTERYIKARQTYGQTQSEAIAEMKQLSRDAREVGALTGGKFVVQMDDFYKAVDDVRTGIDALTVSQKGLSKFMKIGVAVGKQLGLTYDQTLSSMKKLTLGMTQNYDVGFATVEQEQDLEYALSKEGQAQIIKDYGTEGGAQKIADLRNIQEGVQKGTILPDRAAKEQAEVLAGSTVLNQARLSRSIEDYGAGGPGALNMVEARLGTQFDRGMRLIFEKLVAQKQAGKPFSLDDMEKALLGKEKDIVNKNEASYQLRQGAAQAGEADIGKKFAEFQEKALNLMSEAVNSFLDSVKKLADWVAGLLGGKTKVVDGMVVPVGSAAPAAAGGTAPIPTPALVAVDRPTQAASLTPSRASTSPEGDILLRIPASALRVAGNVFRSQDNSTEVATG